MRHEAEMANIARDEAKCYINIEAGCRVLYFPYSTWQGNDLTLTYIYIQQLIVLNTMSDLMWACRHELKCNYI